MMEMAHRFNEFETLSTIITATELSTPMNTEDCLATSLGVRSEDI